MKRFFILGMAALSIMAVSCKSDKAKEDSSAIDWSKVTVNGFYVAGPATGSDEIRPECVMAAGNNEVTKQVREGMFEKYIVLEADKDFYLLYNDGGDKERYSAELAEFVTPEEEAYQENPESVLKGDLLTGDSVPAMKVSKTGLYHIVLDINKVGDLQKAQILLLDASDFGVRGGMNSWGFSSATEKTEFSNEGTTFTFKDQELAKNGEFKFSTGHYWKVTLDDAGNVKAETSLGETGSGLGLANHPDKSNNNIAVDKGGKYEITLTFKLAEGTFAQNFSYTVVCTEESKAPETMYMNGGQWGGSTWDWASDGIVELSGIPSAPGLFWCTRWFDATQQFKFCAVKAWNGDFGFGSENCYVEADGFYTVFVDGNDNTVEILPAEVYGIGDAWGENAWDFNGPDVVRFEVDGQVMKATVTNESTAVRVASKVKPSAQYDGLTNNGWFDWWKTEFVWFDGKIAYRGAGNDQERVAVSAGQTITLDFNAGTVEIEEAGPVFAIDGDFAEWEDLEACTTLKDAAKYPHITEMKGYADADFIYVFFKGDKDGVAEGQWNNLRVCFDKEGDNEGLSYWGMDGKYDYMVNIYSLSNPTGAACYNAALDGGATTGGTPAVEGKGIESGDDYLYEVKFDKKKFNGENTDAFTGETIGIGAYTLNKSWGIGASIAKLTIPVNSAK